jgi:hypothetical protein
MLLLRQRQKTGAFPPTARPRTPLPINPFPPKNNSLTKQKTRQSPPNEKNTKTGFEKPSAIQQKGIVPFTKGIDVIQQAQSGTGKTATFCAGILNNLDVTATPVECQALVLAPTRELAQQIEKVRRERGGVSPSFSCFMFCLFFLFRLRFVLVVV